MHSLKAVSLVTVFFTILAVSKGDNPLEIKTKSGKLKGHTVSTIVGKDVDGFFGIPYGASVSGKSRFGPAKEVGTWDGVLDATKLPNPCLNIMDPKWRELEFLSKQDEVEDCLKLNIWVPKPRPKKSAVMVWIHGGAYSSGSSDMSIYNGGNLAAQENIIVVSMNYRLSGFGFLYLDHPLAPGNAGLMDQALSLKWVKKNIKAFGGDPQKITIFGESAGGGSVGLQLLAPSSLDLFRSAILQSGSGADFWAAYSPEEALEQSLRLAKEVGCPANLEKRDKVVECLQGVDAKKLQNAIFEMDKHLNLLFKPVVDGNFLPDCPVKMLSEGKFCTEKSILIGYNKDDGAFAIPFTAPDVKFKEDTVFTEEQIKHIMSKSTYNYKLIDGLQLELVKHTYTDWETYPDDRVAASTQLIRFLTDRWFACGSLNVATKMSGKGNSVFFYRFDHVPENPLMPIKMPLWIGSSHGDELALTFGHLLQQKNEDTKVSKQMMRYWANFAKHSDPNDEYLPNWPKYNSQEKMMMQFHGKGLTLMKNDRVKECAFWENVFPKIKSQAKDEL